MIVLKYPFNIAYNLTDIITSQLLYIQVALVDDYDTILPFSCSILYYSHESLDFNNRPSIQKVEGLLS